MVSIVVQILGDGLQLLSPNYGTADQDNLFRMASLSAKHGSPADIYPVTRYHFEIRFLLTNPEDQQAFILSGPSFLKSVRLVCRTPGPRTITNRRGLIICYKLEEINKPCRLYNNLIIFTVAFNNFYTFIIKIFNFIFHNSFFK